jgi:hypothetical protein
MVDFEQKFVELSAKYEAEKSKYDNKVTRKACLIVGIICFVAGLALG